MAKKKKELTEAQLQEFKVGVVRATLTYHLGEAHDQIERLLKQEPEAAGAPQAKLALTKIIEAAEIMGVDLKEDV